MLWTKMMFSLLFTKSITDFVEWLQQIQKEFESMTIFFSFYGKTHESEKKIDTQPQTHLLHTCTSVSKANSRSVSNLWCIGDHLNSGMRNMVVRGPGLNWRRCSSVMGIPLKPKSTRRSLSSWAAVRPWRACNSRGTTFLNE